MLQFFEHSFVQLPGTHSATQTIVSADYRQGQYTKFVKRYYTKEIGIISGKTNGRNIKIWITAIQSQLINYKIVDYHKIATTWSRIV